MKKPSQVSKWAWFFVAKNFIVLIILGKQLFIFMVKLANFTPIFLAFHRFNAASVMPLIVKTGEL
ncbi:hypothetical protein AO385_0427 [Moraxella catarrhalis]|uniref:Uncharacterized protein n=1 Tax=Moraxella catarrhalis TaxID=480 RepID=A0A198UP71_MORCA|nr:hypothetical protein AO383_1879 [Moraxella catarrhalis]OAU98074.1 hypothetical protein AO384_0321 [Moraxella catarrhalis]OAV00299.1 hypothetical protein AO382_1449 [Moraxella catarrhalis]OAV03701.1 hypothetical protein AO385_0427 [Moraxella catarrhalis]